VSLAQAADPDSLEPLKNFARAIGDFGIMGKRFEVDEEHHRLLQGALARLDTVRRKRAAIAHAGARANAKRRDKEKRMARATALAASVPNRKRVRRLALPGYQMLCARMDPDVWYTFGELRAAMPEYSYRSVQAWLYQKGRRLGLFDRAGNPDFDDSVPERAQASGRYLYRLSGKGASEAQEWLSAIGGQLDAGANEKSA